MRKKAETQLLTVKMAKGDYEKLRQLAEDENRPMSEIVRMAVQSYMNAAGVKGEIRVKRGGDRRKKDDDQEPGISMDGAMRMPYAAR